MKFLVDSDILIFIFGNRPGYPQLIDEISAERTAISIISFGELYEGAMNDPEPASELEVARVRRFLYTFHVINLSDPIMERFARIRADLRQRGQMIPDCDILIGATAVEHQLTLVTGNLRHFQRIPDIDIYDLT